jgi:hypothetical protein
MPARIPVLFLTRVAAVPGVLALRANLEVLRMAQNLASMVPTIIGPFERGFTKPSELAD